MSRQKVLIAARVANIPGDADLIALINHLSAAGWDVTAKTGSLADENFRQYDALIISADGTNDTPHVDSAVLNSFPIPIVSMCRYTSRVSLGLTGASVIASTNQIVRATGNTDPRNVWPGIELPVVVRSALDGVTAGTINHYHPGAGFEQYSMVAERIASNGYRRVHFSIHDWSNGHAPVAFYLLQNYLPDPDFTYDIEIVNHDTEEPVLFREGVRQKDSVLYGLPPGQVFRGRVRPNFRGQPFAWPPSILFDTNGPYGLTLDTQEDGQDSFSGTGLTTEVLQASFAIQEQNDDTFSGTMQEVTIEVPTNLRVANVTRTTGRFEWDEPV